MKVLVLSLCLCLAYSAHIPGHDEAVEESHVPAVESDIQHVPEPIESTNPKVQAMLVRHRREPHHHKCRTCGGGGGAYIAQPVYVVQPVHSGYGGGGGCNTCGGGGYGGHGGGGISGSWSQSSSSSSSGSLSYGKK